MKIIALIPARSGSKRIKNKNFKDFCGKPIVEYPIAVLKGADIFNDVILYTDNISYNFGITMMQRDKADDHQTTAEMLSQFLCQYKDNIDYICIAYPTSVFLTKDNVLCAKSYMAEGIESVVTVCEYPHPIERAFEIDNGYMYMIDEDYMAKRTQDCERSYYDAGQMYFINVKAFKAQGRIFMERTRPIIVNAIDIDTEEDWKLAEAYYERTTLAG